MVSSNTYIHNDEMIDELSYKLAACIADGST